MRQAESSRRTAEIEEISNLYFIHPLASRLVPVLARMGFTANAVSLTGMLFGAAAGVAYYHYQDPRWAITGFVLMLAWHVMDGADGQLARLTGSQSQFGQMVDGVADYVTFISVYAGLALALGRELGSRAYLLVAAAGLCHSVQAAVYEVQRREYDFWGWGRESARLTPRILPRDADASALHRLFDLLYRLNYIGLNFPAVGITVRFRKAMSAALERRPEQADIIRRRFREAYASLLRRWSLLSSNYRTLGIFIAALLGAPQYYFWFEILGFSAILGWLIHRTNSRCRVFFATLDASASPAR